MKWEEQICLVQQHPQKQAGSLSQEWLRFLRHRTYHQHSHPPSFKGKSGNDRHKPDQVLPLSYGALSKPKAVVHWCGHRAALPSLVFGWDWPPFPLEAKASFPPYFILCFHWDSSASNCMNRDSPFPDEIIISNIARAGNDNVVRVLISHVFLIFIF